MSANSHYARVSGIGPVTVVAPLTALFAKIVKQPLPAFLDSIAAIQEAGYIPGVMGAARCTLDAAKDAKTFGNLKGDMLSGWKLLHLDNGELALRQHGDHAEPASGRQQHLFLVLRARHVDRQFARDLATTNCVLSYRSYWYLDNQILPI